ncbi:DUF4124 domain-containing protein [Thermodesulfobacteriota bacterium]
MRLIAWAVCAFLVCGAMQAFADIYSYEDETGQLVFTNDLNSVPEHLRPSVEVEKEYESTTPAQSRAAPDKVASVTSGTEEKERAGKTDEEKVKALEQKIRDLDIEYQKLAKAKEQAAADRRVARTKLNRKGAKTRYRVQIHQLDKRQEELGQMMEENRKIRAALEKELQVSGESQ